MAVEATFQKYWVARFLSTFCVEVINVSIAWKIYDITENPLYLGLVGLTQFVPLILLGLISGYVSDKYNRKKIFFWCLLMFFTTTFVHFVCLLFSAFLVLG